MEKRTQNSMVIEKEEDVLQAMEYTVQLAQSLGYLSNEQLLLSLVTEESLVNALEFCSKLEKMMITIKWDVVSSGLELSVTQTGTMFDLEKKEDINYGSRGRGLQIILNIMDEVWLEQVDDEIVTLHMKKHLHKDSIQAQSIC